MPGMHMLSEDRRLRANGLDIVYRRHGREADPAVLLIMGLGGQLLSWPEALCKGLVDEGYQVIRFDNRDAGLSTKLERHGRPRILQVAAASSFGRPVRVPYRLMDMVADAVALLDGLSVPRAHVVGISMGGMIGQIMAAAYPGRVLSLASLMSTSGDPSLPGPSLKLRMRMLRRRANDPEGALRDSMRSIRMIGGSGYPRSDEELEAVLRPQMQRNVCPDGVLRQLAAIVASGSRTALLSQVGAPTLVMHGEEDPLVPVAAAHDLARRIPGASKDIIPGLGHDLPIAAMPRICDSLLGHLQRSRQAMAA